jgi:hypothetical protein
VLVAKRAERFGCFAKGRLSRHCHGSRGKTLKNRKQKVNTEEKLALALHRNLMILLGKLPLRQIVIKLLQWLLTGCSGCVQLCTNCARIERFQCIGVSF